MVVRKRTRTILFVLCTIIFLISGAYAILTMQGLVFDIEHFKLTKSGSIYAHFTPSNASLFVNSEKSPKTQSIFGGGILLSSLVPETYSISVMKDGYTPFIKTLDVLPGKVSVAARITLWKTNPKFETLRKNVDDVFPTSKGFVIKTTSSTLLIENTQIKGDSVEVYDINSSYIITKKEKSHFLIDLENPTIAKDFSVLFKTILKSESIDDNSLIKEITFHPFSKNKLIIHTTKNLYILDIKRSVLSIMDTTKTSPISFAVGASELFIVNKNGDLIIHNLVVGSEYIFPIHASTTAKIIPSENGAHILFLDKEKNLSLFTRAKEEYTKIAENIEYATFSPDNVRAAYIDSNKNASILYLDDYEGDTQKDAGTIDSFKLAPTTNVETFEWIPFSENYFLIKMGKIIRIEELDSRPPRNIAVIAKDAKKSLLIHGDLFIVNDNGDFSKTTIEE